MEHLAQGCLLSSFSVVQIFINGTGKVTRYSFGSKQQHKLIKPVVRDKMVRSSRTGQNCWWTSSDKISSVIIVVVFIVGMKSYEKYVQSGVLDKKPICLLNILVPKLTVFCFESFISCDMFEILIVHFLFYFEGFPLCIFSPCLLLPPLLLHSIHCN